MVTSTARKAWSFRDFIFASVKRDFVARYLGTQLGFFWAIAQPLALIAIYTLVFSEIMRPTLPGHDSRFAYSVYLCAGILTWTLFSELVGRSVGIFVHNAPLLKKTSLPRVALPLSVALSGLAHFLVPLILFIAFLLAIGAFPGLRIVAVVPVVLLVVAFAMGLGLLLGSINVFYRDVEQTIGLLLNFWFWLTPIVYPTRALPDWLASVLAWNPMWPVVNAMQTIFLDHRWPDPASLVYPALLALGLNVLAVAAFRRLGDEIVDEL